MPNEPAPHPEHPYSWSVAHYVPRVVIRRGDVVAMVLSSERGAKPIGVLRAERAAEADGLVQGLQLTTAPPNSPGPVLDDGEDDPYYFPQRQRQMLFAGDHVTLTVSIGSPIKMIDAETIVPVDCALDGFGLQVAPMDWERRREVERIAREGAGG